MPTVDLSDVRLFLHVLAATVWVGGQLTLAGLTPVARRFGREVTRALAQRFNIIAWTAYVVLIVTGVWNLAVTGWGEPGSAFRANIEAKLGAVALSGLAAALHARARSPRGLAVWGALSGLAALAALFFGCSCTAEHPVERDPETTGRSTLGCCQVMSQHAGGASGRWT
jgi:putative copper export protein